jgi:hypothetical protein
MAEDLSKSITPAGLVDTVEYQALLDAAAFLSRMEDALRRVMVIPKHDDTARARQGEYERIMQEARDALEGLNRLRTAIGRAYPGYLPVVLWMPERFKGCRAAPVTPQEPTQVNGKC